MQKGGRIIEQVRYYSYSGPAQSCDIHRVYMYVEAEVGSEVPPNTGSRPEEACA